MRLNTKLNTLNAQKAAKKRTSHLLLNQGTNLSISATAVLLCLSLTQACQATPAPEVLLTSPVTSRILQGTDVSSLTLSATYPKPLDNQVIHLLKVAQLVEPSMYQLQVQIGLTIMQDCNQSKLMGELQQHAINEPNQLKNRGKDTASYYWLESLMQAPMVTMPCIDPKVATFVPLGDTIIIGPDGLSENVFYLPQHAQLRYRLWRANEDWSYSH